MRTQCTVHTPFRAISYRFNPFQPYMSFHLSISRWKLYYPHFAYSIKIHAHIFVCECHFECFFVSLEMFSIKSPTSHNVLCGSNAENIFQIAPIQLRVLLVFVECTTESMWVFFPRYIFVDELSNRTRSWNAHGVNAKGSIAVKNQNLSFSDFHWHQNRFPVNFNI